MENCRKHEVEVLYGTLSSCGRVNTYEILDSECWRNRLVLGYGQPGLWINGASGVRFVIDQLSLDQPGLLKGKNHQPNLKALRARVAKEKGFGSK